MPYCERCGNLIGPAATLLRVGLRGCKSCGLYACDRCWARAAGTCPGCGISVAGPAAAGVARKNGRAPNQRGRDRPWPIAAGIAFLAVSAFAIIVGNPVGPAGNVGAAIGTPAAITSALPAISQSPPARSGGATALPSGEVTPSQGPTPARPSSAPLASTPAASTPTGTDPGMAVVIGAWFRGWSDPSSVTRGQVLAVVENLTSGWVLLPTGASHYTIRDPAGNDVTSGAFAYAFPQRLPPGGRAYLVDSIDASFADLATFDDVAVAPVFEDSEPAADALVVTEVSWAEAESGGLTASGRVTNQGRSEVRDVVVAVVFLDAAGSPLSVIYDPEPRSLVAGASRAFTTAYPHSGPMNPADIFRAEPIAGPYQP